MSIPVIIILYYILNLGVCSLLCHQIWSLWKKDTIKDSANAN